MTRRICTLLLLIASTSFSQPNFTVSGKVISGGTPVSGATVNYYVTHPTQNIVLADFNVITASDGTFQAAIPPSRLHLHISPPPGTSLLAEHIFNINVTRDLSLTIPLIAPFRLTGRAVAPPGRRSSVKIEVWSLSTHRDEKLVSSDGSFDFTLAPDRYSVLVWPDDPSLGPARTNIDTRSGDVLGLSIPLGGAASSIVPRDPPIASRISITAADAAGSATVRGESGSVAPMASVLVANIQTGQASFTISAADGSFIAPMFAPPGSFIEIKHDVTGRYLSGFPSMEVPPGTILYVPSNPQLITALGPLRSSVQFDAILGGEDVGQWFLSADFNAPQWKSGQPVSLTGTLTMVLKDFKDFDIARLKISGQLSAEQIFDAEGRHGQPRQQFLSTALTPTGLPIANISSGPWREVGNVVVDSLKRVGDSRIEASWRVDGRFSPSLGDGYYRLLFEMSFEGLPPAITHSDVFPVLTRGTNTFAAIPSRIVKIGDPRPPRMLWMLALNDLVDGQRGLLSQEDRGRVDFASFVVTRTETPILPRTKSYRLEPFAPLISTSNGNLPDAPQIAFHFPTGELSVRVLKPDGGTDSLGSAPFLQSRNGSPSSARGIPISGTDQTTAHVSDLYQLTTLDPRFDYTFTQYGAHRVIVSGSVNDVWGNRYEGGGTFEVHVAKPLDLDAAVLSGTPFEVGNQISSVVVVRPPVPADITMTTVILPSSDPARAIRTVITGRADRFGYFHAAPVAASAAGEYRVDVTARFTDSEGQLWSGGTTWGSVIETPGTPLIAHGRRGFQDASEQAGTWFLVRSLNDRGAGHLMFPFHRGDVMWMEKNDTAAAAPTVTIQDNEGSFAARVRALTQPENLQRLDAQIGIGEIPLKSNCFEEGCVRAYWYGSVQRPGIHVRETITEDNIAFTYWRFQDFYQLQFGNGANSDLPNDFKFQFGGAVFRDPEKSFHYYGAYASLFVLLPNPDSIGVRIMPPFQGNGGGPTGGPLFRLKGRDIDLFFHPTAVRPGTILVQGDTASFAGYSAPTLASKITIDVTAPSGRVRTIKGQASKVGYFYDSGYDFPVDEPGVWKAKVRITFDGVTSAGQVTAPFPTGDVLGSREGEFYFYVVRGDAVALTVIPSVSEGPGSAGGAQSTGMAPPAPPGPSLSRGMTLVTVRPAEGPITFNVAPPAGLTNLQLTYTTTMPGFVLEEGTTSALAYTYDAPRLAHDFPNLDLFDADGFAGTDTIAVSLLVSGTDAAGARKHCARQIVIQGEELQIPEQQASPAQTRRRAAR